MSAINQAQQIYDSDWWPAASGGLTASINGSHYSVQSVYVLASGSNAPTNGKYVDPIVPGNASTLELPAAGSGAVTYVGATISGSNVTNKAKFVNIVPGTSMKVTVDAGTTSWVRIVVIGR